MSFTLTQSGNKSTITLKGELTLPNAEEIRKVFAQGLTDANELSLRFENVNDVDLSFLQLICSMHRTAIRAKKQVSFDNNPPKIFREAAETAGYGRIKGCKPGCESSCLWAAAAGV